MTRAAATIPKEVDIEGMRAEERGTFMLMKMWRRRRWKRGRRRRRRGRIMTDDVRENHTSQYKGATMEVEEEVEEKVEVEVEVEV